MKCCQYKPCSKPLSLYTKFGRKISPGRLKKQKFCSDSCARKDYHYQIALDKALMKKQEAFIDQFIYGRLP